MLVYKAVFPGKYLDIVIYVLLSILFEPFCLFDSHLVLYIESLLVIPTAIYKKPRRI